MAKFVPILALKPTARTGMPTIMATNGVPGRVHTVMSQQAAIFDFLNKI